MPITRKDFTYQIFCIHIYSPSATGKEMDDVKEGDRWGGARKPLATAFKVSFYEN